MNDIEEMLARSGNAAPRRELSEQFTQQILNHIEARPRKTGWRGHLGDFFTMKLTHKPVLFAILLGAITLLGGTAYATGGFGFLNAFFKGEQPLANGGRIVQVETKDCKMTLDVFAHTSQQNSDTLYHYRIKKDSALTNEQVTQMVQGKCEFDTATQKQAAAWQELANKDVLSKGTLTGGYIDSEITTITESSISLVARIPYGNPEQAEPAVKIVSQTFTKLDPQLVVEGLEGRIQLKDLRVGDHVASMYILPANDATLNGETAPHAIDYGKVTLVYLAKNSANLSAALNFDKYNAKEFERVEPCETSKNTSGFCSYEELQ